MNRIQLTQIARGMVIGGITCLASCRNSGKTPDQIASNGPSAVSQPSPIRPLFSRHYVEDSCLRALMRCIARRSAALGAESADSASPEDRQQMQSFEEAVALADALSQTAMQIPSLDTGGALNEMDRHRFDAEAIILHDQALEFKDAARMKKIERMQRTLNDINTTCIACHSRFRGLADDLEPRAALGVDSAAWFAHRNGR